MGLHLRGNILGYEEVKAPKKLVVTGARNTFEAHRMFDQVEFHEKELLPFYDLHLKGSQQRLHGSRAGEAVRARRQCLACRRGVAAARNFGRVLSAQRPVGQRHLAQRRRAVDRSRAPSRGADKLHLSGLGMGQRCRRDRPRRPGRSGAARADLHHARRSKPISKSPDRSCSSSYASSTAIDTQFIVKLTDQHPQDAAARAKDEQPAYTPVSKGWLKASHREKDAARSKPRAAVLHPHQSAAA